MRGRIPRGWCLVAVIVIASSTPAAAHEVRPGYLEISEVGDGRYDVLFKTPSRGGLRLRLQAILPESCSPTTPVSARLTRDALFERWTVRCESSLAGETIAIGGLNALLTDVLVRIQPLEGSTVTVRVRPGSSSFVVPRDPAIWQIAVTYLLLGVEHIVGGIDHLLFVLALILIVSARWVLFQTVTAFTVAHSLTLAAASLGYVGMPGAPVEAVIALSIVFLASELARDRMGQPGLTSKHPWLVAFTFGLLHGFGFAGALSEIGLPERQIPVALLLFNIGVELGQLVFVAGVLAVLAFSRFIRVPQPVWGWRVPTYSIGCLASFWAIERVAAFW